ncbi:MAG TPA: hypothetical protein VFK73_01670, partial [Paludibacter sp.]|nr:hypothetical protein [Paludibacter sp.]
KVLLNHQGIIETFAPLLLCWVPYRLLLYKRLKSYKRAPVLVYVMLAGFTVFFPLVLSQDLIKNLTGNVTEIENPSQVVSHPPTVFYRIKNYYADKSRAYYTFNANTRQEKIAGGYKESLDLYICYDLPLLNSQADTVIRKPGVRMAIEYRNTIGNSLARSEKDNLIAAFKSKSKADFDQKNLTGFQYFDGEQNISQQAQYQQELQSNNTIVSRPDYYLNGRHGEIASNNEKLLSGICKIYGFAALVYLLLLLIPRVDEKYINM